MRRTVIWFAIGFGVIAATAMMLRPADRGGESNEYFSTLNEQLQEAGYSRPLIFIDLDKVDQNLAAINEHIRAPLHYRIVDKSLPSIDLIRYVMTKTGSKRVMSFHEPYLSMLIGELDNDVDYLLGKPMPAASAGDFYAALTTEARTHASRQVQWLIDTDDRLREYLALAEKYGQRLRVNLEIDVGLHRGGAKTTDDLAAMLEIVETHPDALAFSGFMGYDGHLTHVPVLFGAKEDAVEEAHRELIESYRNFVAYGGKHFPSLFTQPVTFNGAGSSTYRLYTAEHPLNDLAMGSCVVKPSAFDKFTLAEHVPAMYIAAPVLKKIDGFDVPFMDAVAPAAAWWNPNWRKTFYVYGGAWAESVIWPAGAQPNSLTTSPPNENMFPNQNMLNGSDTLPLDVGDFVFYRPKQGDAMSQFEEIVVLRGGKIVDRWKPFPHRL